uniref:Uncharacterized protein n=1 Tax=Rhizophora mucronata TaxID=61149 RepID=A0A2P2NHQ4_RHIMU
MSSLYCLSKPSSLDETAAVLHSSCEASENFEIEYQLSYVHSSQQKQKISSQRK